MTKQAVLTIVALVTVMLGVVVWQIASRSSQEDYHGAHATHDPHGEDAHGHTDPVKDDPYVAARTIASALYSYNPAEDETPLVQFAAMRDQLTGRMLKAAEVPTDPQALDSLYPPQWSSWKESKAVVRGAAESLNYSEHVTGHHVTAKMHMRQIVYFTDGDSTPFLECDMEMEMVLENGVWKASDYRIMNLQGGGRS